MGAFKKQSELFLYYGEDDSFEKREEALAEKG